MPKKHGTRTAYKILKSERCKHMALDRHPSAENPSPREAAELLAQAELASTDSVNATEAPKLFLFSLVFVVAAIFSLYGVISTALWFWSFILFLPLIGWYALWARKRPKSRPASRHSGKYMLGVLS